MTSLLSALLEGHTSIGYIKGCNSRRLTPHSQILDKPHKKLTVTIKSSPLGVFWVIVGCGHSSVCENSPLANGILTVAISF